MRPFLRWAGSKSQLVPQIIDLWNPRYRRYVEPFCGSARVFFAIQPRQALLSDLNDELIATFAQIQSSPDTIAECLSRLATDRDSYYLIRSWNQSALSPNERAARFIYLNTLCFNGLFRTNKMGQFNVPFGSKQSKSSFDPRLLREAGSLMRSATLESSDFEDVVNRTVHGDFLYIDPPYATSGTRVFKQYGKDVFSSNDLDRLTSAVTKAAARGVNFVLSYADVPEIEPFARNWTVKQVQAQRHIAGFTSARRKAAEVLVTNCPST